MISNCDITNNYGTQGGGIYCQVSAMNFENSKLENNSCNGFSSGAGMHLRNTESNVKLNNILIQGNTGAHNGGGIDLEFNYNTVMNNVTFDNPKSSVALHVSCTVEFVVFVVFLSDTNFVTGGLFVE